MGFTTSFASVICTHYIAIMLDMVLKIHVQYLEISLEHNSSSLAKWEDALHQPSALHGKKIYNTIWWPHFS